MTQVVKKTKNKTELSAEDASLLLHVHHANNQILYDPLKPWKPGFKSIASNIQD